MDAIRQDLAYGLRTLQRNPGFAVLVALILAIGIGGTAAIFTVIDGVLLRPLPYSNAERLVWMRSDDESGGHFSVSAPNWADWKERSRSLESTSAYQEDVSFHLTGSGEPERISGMSVSPEFFQTLGVPAARGRTFIPADAQSGGPRVVAVSWGLWQRRFAADPDIMGRTITLNGQPRTIIGVMPQLFRWGRAELWVPVDLPGANRRGGFTFGAVARLRPGVSVESAEAEIARIAATREQETGDANAGIKAVLIPLGDHLLGPAKRPLQMLAIAVALVMLIACANVASLLLVRSAGRDRELAIRSALGADQKRLVRQLLTESMLISAAGGVIGLLLAQWGTDALMSLNEAALPRAEFIRVDTRVLAFTCAVSALTALLCGLGPALHGARRGTADTLRGSGRGVAGGRSRNRALGFLVIVEMALAVVPLTGAGLLIRSLRELFDVEIGLQPEDVLTANITLPVRTYPDDPSRIAFYDRLLQSLAAVPGMDAVGAASHAPLTGNDAAGSFSIRGQPDPPPDQTRWTELRAVSPEYFRAAGIPLKNGRTFEAGDVESAPHVAIVDEAFARRFFPGEEVLGKRLRLHYDTLHDFEIVGVAADVRHRSLDAGVEPQLYLPYQQQTLSFMTLLVRSELAPAIIAPTIRAHVRSLDPDLPVYDIQSMENLVAQSTAPRRMNTLLLGLFAGMALLLAAAGVYGVLSFAVQQRVTEIGVRLALGATAGDVRALLLRKVLTLAIAGVVLGLAIAWPLARLLEGLLFGVTAHDPATFGMVPVLLITVALAAAFVPVRRALRLDPLIALRAE